MNSILDFIRQFFGWFKVWVIIMPWEQALRVRFGHYVTEFTGGTHLKLPFVDQYYVQSVRTRISDTGKQTVSTVEGRVVTFCGAIGYNILDVRLLYNTLHHAEETVASIVRNALAQYIVTHRAEDCTPELISERVSGIVDLEQYGLGNVKVYVTELAVVRTYRLIGDKGFDMYGGLNTTVVDHPAVPV